VAVLLVVFHHAFPSFVSGGFIGVDIFFVISGYLITSIISRDMRLGRFSIMDFYARRARRIFPALAIVLISVLAAGWFLLLPNEFEILGKHALSGVAFVANLVFNSEAGYFDRASITKPLLHIWSLSVEEQFYLCWPALFFFMRRFRRGPLALLLAFAGASLAFSQMDIQTNPSGVFFLSWYRAWELLAGGALACGLSTPWGLASQGGPKVRGSRPSRREVMIHVQSATGLGLIAASAALLGPGSPFPGLTALPSVLGAFLLIDAGEMAFVNKRLLSMRLLVWIGLVSYPLYLWHWPILSYAYMAMQGRLPVFVLVAAILASVALAYAPYRLVEIRVRTGARKTAKALASGGVLAATGAAALLVMVQGGFPDRLPKLARETADFRYSYGEAYREGVCFLRPEQDPSQFSGCLPERTDAPTVLLWGDSHAAHLYPGFKAVFGDSLSVGQITASMCPPIPGYEAAVRPHCHEVNQYALEAVDRVKPDMVVLAAYWDHYDWKGIRDAVEALKAKNVGRIVVVGPVPDWEPQALPEAVCKEILLSAEEATVPSRLTPLHFAERRALDEEMGKYVRELGVDYFSALDALCDDGSCLVSLDGAPDTLVGWDNSHLTTAGAAYLVSNFKSFLPKAPPKLSAQ